MKQQGTKEKGKEQQELSNRITMQFGAIIRRALIIVCLESILIASILAMLYISGENRGAVQRYAQQIDEAMQGKVAMVETIASGVSSGTLESNEEILAYVDSMVAIDEQVSAVYSCYDENITIMSGGWQPPDDFVVTERAWYKGAQENPDEVYISDPYVDLQTGGVCITLAKCTYSGGAICGVVGMDMYMDDMVSLIEESYMGNSYVFLTTSDGTILVK